MSITELPPLIRECVDGGTTPVTVGEIRARAVVARHAPRRVPPRHRARIGVAATGLATAGIAGALVASQIGAGTTTGAQAVLTAATLRHMATASRTAMTSGRAAIDWTSGRSTVRQNIAFDGANWNDVMSASGASHPGAASPTMRLHVITWHGKVVSRVVGGQAYHYPAIRQTAHGMHLLPGWMHLVMTGAAGVLNIPDPRKLLGVLSPSADFVKAGHQGRLTHLRASTPRAVPLRPLDGIIQSDPAHSWVSALDVWVTPAGVVVKARVMVSGHEGAPVTVMVTFSQTGRPQRITAPAHAVPVGGGAG